MTRYSLMTTYIVLTEGGVIGETKAYREPERGEKVSITFRDIDGMMNRKSATVEEVLDEK